MPWPHMIFGTDIGAELVRHPAIQAVGFTGSLSGGKALWQLAQQRPQPVPVFAEMSAINPLMILPQALATRAETLANELVASFTLGCGQFCTKPGLILALRGEGFTRFTQALKAAVNQAPAQTMVCGGCWGLLRPCTKGRCRQTLSRLSPIPRPPS